MFRFNFATEMWSSATDLKSWKLMPYPKPSKASNSGASSTLGGARNTDEASMAYFHVDICYPVAARNIPMVKMCLDHGVDVNQRLPNGMTLLEKAVATAYEYTAFDGVTTVLLMRRDSRKMIQLLLEYGASPGADAVALARNEATRVIPFCASQLDWLMEQLLTPQPHPDFRRLLSMTDAVWAGESDKLDTILAEEPDICRLAEAHGASPLGVAAFRGDERMLNALLGHGASPDALDPIGSSALAIAVASERQNIIYVLLQHNASLSILDPILNLTPLEHCAREGNISLCAAILEHMGPQNSNNAKELLKAARTSREALSHRGRTNTSEARSRRAHGHASVPSVVRKDEARGQ